MGFIKTLKDYSEKSSYLIALSGGADSTALLHLFSSYSHVRAIHINHGIQAQAHNWQQHCQQLCQQLGMEIIIEHAQLTNSSEDACRKARYDIFSKYLRKNEILLTGHHSQDQAETVLLNLLRGTGLKGICGIAPLTRFANGYLARPLLEHSPQQLKQYLIHNNLKWIEDASNKDNHYRRNHIRNITLPTLQKPWPQGITNIARSANNSRQSLDLLLHLLDFTDKYLPLKKLLDLPQPHRATLLYHWLNSKNLPVPDKSALEQLSHDFTTARIDRTPHYQNKYYQLYRWQQAIYCIKNFDSISDNDTYHWDTNSVFKLPNGCGELRFKGTIKHLLVVKFKQKGQKLTNHPHRFNKSVKKLFQEHQIPVWEKLNTPFIYHNKQLISLGYDWSNTIEFKGLIEYDVKFSVMQSNQ